jgi:phage gpG-like protein
MFKIKPKIKAVVDRTSDVQKSIRELTKLQVLVGVPAKNAGRQENGPATNAMLAFVHNYGSPAQNIPARPFMEPGIRETKDPVADRMARAAQASLDGRKDDINRNLIGAGLIATNGIKAKITSGPFKALKPATIAARKRRGRTGTKPLLDTGQLRNSITFVVRRKP